VTRELEKLAICEKYKGKEQIHNVDGAGIRISHIGHAVVNTPNYNFILKVVLHVPKAHKNFVSVYQLIRDNSIFLEIHPGFFLIKDQVSRRILLRGRNHRGLYPIPDPSAVKQILAVFRPSLEQWHSRLGHPSLPVVAQVISHFYLPVLDESNKHSVCNACQQAKSHQLPYSVSHHKLQFPLELSYSDVWGPSSISARGYKYYVSFVDDSNKFTWIYLLKFNSQVFQLFREFHNLVHRFFSRKIITMQTD
jgi:hypothetical protein